MARWPVSNPVKYHALTSFCACSFGERAPACLLLHHLTHNQPIILCLGAPVLCSRGVGLSAAPAFAGLSHGRWVLNNKKLKCASARKEKSTRRPRSAGSDQGIPKKVISTPHLKNHEKPGPEGSGVGTSGSRHSSYKGLKVKRGLIRLGK